MKNPVEMSNAQILSWLEKTHKTTRKYFDNGGEMKWGRGLDLLDRYNDLAFECKGNRYELWKEYCDLDGSSYTHDGYDLFA